MIWKFIISLTVVVALVWAVLYGKGMLNVHRGLEPPKALAVLVLEKSPKTAPAVSFSDASGRRHSLADLRGHYVLLNLWATWCAPCVGELPALAQLSRLAPGLKVLAVDVGHDDVRAASQFLKSHNAALLATYVDSDIMMVRSFGAYGLPTTVLIDPAGAVIAKAEGPADWSSGQSVAYFKAMTGAKVAAADSH